MADYDDEFDLVEPPPRTQDQLKCGHCGTFWHGLPKEVGNSSFDWPMGSVCYGDFPPAGKSKGVNEE